MKNKYITSKRCNFVRLSKDPLKPLKKPKKPKSMYNKDKQTIKAWRDGWFKGEFELKDESR